MARPPATDEERAKRVLSAMGRLEEAERARRVSSGSYWLLALLLAARGRLLHHWRQLVRPDQSGEIVH